MISEIILCIRKKIVLELEYFLNIVFYYDFDNIIEQLSKKYYSFQYKLSLTLKNVKIK